MLITRLFAGRINCRLMVALPWLLTLSACPLLAQEHVRLMPQLGMRSVKAAAISADGRYVLTGSVDGAVRLWDVSSGEQVLSFVGSSGAVNAVAFSPDGLHILAGSDGGTADVWDAVTGRHERSFPGHGYVSAASFSQDSRVILIGSDDGTIRLWDLEGRGPRSSFVVPGYGAAVVLSLDGRYLISSRGSTAWLWDAATGQQLRIFEGHLGDIESVALSPDSRYVLTGSLDKTARLWDAATGRQLRTFTGHTDAILSVTFSPDGRYVLTGSRDRSARLWDAATGQQLRSLEGHTDGVDSVTFSPDGLYMLTGGEDSTARLWEAATGRPVRSFVGRAVGVGSVAFSPDGHYLLTGSLDQRVGFWDAASGQQLRSMSEQTDTTCMAISPNGRLVLTGGMNYSVRLWDAATGQRLRSFDGHSDSIYFVAHSFVAFSPDGRLILTGDADNTAHLWEVATGKRLRSLVGHTGEVYSVAFSPDGLSVLTGSEDGSAKLWETTTGRLIRSFQEQKGPIDAVAFSPSGHFVLTGSYEGAATLWDSETGQPVRSLTHFNIRSVAFSREGSFVLIGGDDNTVRLRDGATGAVIRRFVGHSGPILSVAFSTDGRFMLTGSLDTTTRLWDFATGKQLAVLISFNDGGWAITDSEGRYDTNDPDSAAGLVWVTDRLDTIELKDLKDNYYTPNLLARILKGERLPAVKGLDKVPAPPAVAIESPYAPESKGAWLTIEDRGGGVGKLVVSVNGRTAKMIDHPLGGEGAGKNKVTVDLSDATLQPGENTITAFALDAGNQIRSHEATSIFNIESRVKGFKTDAGEAAADYKPQFYAIVIGTATFGNQKMNLLYPAHDAQSMMTGLKIGAGKLFGEENVHLRLLTTAAVSDRDQPTKENIRAAFEGVQKNAKPTDVFLVYLSGHGVNLRTEKDSYYYLTADARSLELGNNPELRDISTVSSTELKQWLGAKNMPLKEVLILDTCAAGAANEELAKLVEARDVPPDQRRAIEFLKDASGTIILMGSAADRSSYEASKYGQGLLTYALLEGMKGRSIEDSSRLNVSRWFQFASEEVPQLAQSIGGIQKPVIAAPKGTGFPVALLNPADQALIPLATIKPELLHLSCHQNKDDHDPLALGAAVREQIREISHPSARGGDTTEPPVVYLDDVNDGPADALTPRIVYTASGSDVTLTLRIDRGDDTLKEETLNIHAADRAALARGVAEKLVSMAIHIPTKPPS